MEKDLNKIVYSKEVIDFVKASSDYCIIIESAGKNKLTELIESLNKLLPALYLYAVNLPQISSQFEEANEKFVTESDYNYLRNKVQGKFGQYDAFNEVYDEQWYESEEPIIENISENLADIYQDTRDFLMLYNVGTYELMNDAIWECKFNFEESWGQKLVNTLRAIHILKYKQTIKDEETNVTQQNTTNTDNLIISKRQQGYKDEE